MNTVTYSNNRVEELIESHFKPVKISFKENRDLAARLGAHWTPQVQFMDPADSQVHHEFIGFLPPDDFLAEASFALGKVAYDRGMFSEASSWFRKTSEDFPGTETSPQALYYLGVSEFKRTRDHKDMFAAWDVLIKRHPKSSWATKASFIDNK
ncbi:MAG: hypothetical protein ACE5KK_04445 [Candidatus Brocadiales bacterium]